MTNKPTEALVSRPSSSIQNQGNLRERVEIARDYPRSPKQALAQAETLIMLSREVAASCFYSIPRGGRRIEGPSIRLAEIVANSWGNLLFEGYVSQITETHVVAIGQCVDMQTNNCARIEHRTRIVDKDGYRFSEDVITNNANAAISKALRNAIFRVVPRAVVEELEQKARSFAVGKTEDLAKTRQKWLEYFGKAGISKERVLAMLGKEHVGDMDLLDIEKLQGTATALREGDATVAEVFPEDLEDGTGSFKKGEEKKPGRPKKGKCSDEPPQIDEDGLPF